MKPIYLYNGNITPYAVILWHKQSDKEPSYRTVCYNEGEVALMIERHNTPGDFYSELYPQIIMYSPEPDLVAA